MKNILKYILQNIFGLKIYLYLFARYVILKFPFDKKERGFLRFLDLIESSGIILDIGANIGVTTYYIKNKKPGSQVYSFEPVPDNLEVLRKLIKKFGLTGITVCPYALGDKNGTIEMLMPEANKVFFHGLSHVKGINSNISGKSYPVEIKKLDDISELGQSKIAAIKMDVEEYEYYVLKGGESLIKKNRPLIYCELWEGENRDKCFAYFKELEYKTYILQKNHYEDFIGQKGFQNFLFVPIEFCNKLDNA